MRNPVAVGRDADRYQILSAQKKTSSGKIPNCSFVFFDCVAGRYTSWGLTVFRPLALVRTVAASSMQ